MIVRQIRRVLLIPTEIFEDMSAEFDFEGQANIGPVFLSNFNLGQHNSVEQILSLLQQRNKLIVRIQEQIRSLEKKRTEPKPNNEFQAEMTTLPLFNSKLEGFVMVYKIYLRIRIRESTVEE